MPILSSFVSGFQKCALYVRQLERPKAALQKIDVVTFTCFFFLPLHSQIKRYCFEIWYVCCLYVALRRVLRFLVTPQFGILWAFIFEKSKF